MFAEINTGKYLFTAFENQYRIDVIKKKINLKTNGSPVAQTVEHGNAKLMGFISKESKNW